MERIALLILMFLTGDNVFKDDSETRKEYNNAYASNVHPSASEGLKAAYESSVIINRFDEKGILSMGSGNYFKLKHHRFIMTAAHVADQSGALMITEKNGNSTIADVVLIDYNHDIAFLIPREQLEFTKPIKYKIENNPRIGQEVVYCGHPNDALFSSVKGIISTYEEGWILINSFAWPGSSGSVVFTEDGKVAGIISSVSVGSSSFGYQLIQDIVRVGPAIYLTDKILLEFFNDVERKGK